MNPMYIQENSSGGTGLGTKTHWRRTEIWSGRKTKQNFSRDSINHRIVHVIQSYVHDRAIYSVCLKKDRTFTESEEDRVYLLLEIYFPETYPTVEDNNILPFILITDRRRRKENWELAKEVWKLDGNLKPLKLLGVDHFRTFFEWSIWTLYTRFATVKETIS